MPDSGPLAYEVRPGTAADVPELARLLALLGYPTEEPVLVLLEVPRNRRRADAHAFYERPGYVSTSRRFGKPPSPPG